MPTTRGRGGKDRNLLKELAPDFNTYDRARLKVIWDRIKYLEDRVANPPHSGSMVRPQAEANALRWLLEKADAPVPPVSLFHREEN